jgi:MYXO-CTERM domain-containing protein
MKRALFGSFLVAVLFALPGSLMAAPCDNENPCGCGETCVEGACQFLACQGKACGPDGCGGICGECAVGQFCEIDTCRATLPRGCTESATGGCSIKEFQCLAVTDGCNPACTAGNKCAAGVCLADEIGCNPLCDPTTQVCRQNVSSSCGCESCVVDQDPNCLTAWDLACVLACQECGTSCTACEADCTGKECGSNGCGGSCGTCETGTCEDGQCVLCSCTGLECGDDGCGNSCGECDVGSLCDAGECVEDPCKGFSYEGCCAGNTVKWCAGGEIQSEDCADSPVCGWDLDGYYCGTDGGADPDGFFPIACPDCVQACTGKECGDDGCGGLCGVCASDETCEAGQCVTCIPQCEFAECGDDGCGGSCGECDGDLFCVEGMCLQDACMGITDVGCCDGSVMKYCSFGELVEYDCDAEPSCGWLSGPGFYGCGTDGSADPSGTYPLSCGGVCEPMCTGLECGPDGCGGVCGACGANEACEAGLCVCVPACGANLCGDDGCGGSCGTCDADEKCEAGACVPDVCEPACDDKECGEDGCGGSCGDCDADEVCVDSLCELKPCDPVCTGKECGPNGCGGTCGACAADESCNDDGQCVAVEQPDVIEPDVATDAAEEVTPPADEDTDEGGGGGCSVDGGSSFGSFWLLALALALVPFWRRRVA